MPQYDSPDAFDMVDIPVFVLKPNNVGDLVYCVVNDAWCFAAKRARNAVIGKTANDVFDGRHGKIAYDHHQRIANAGVRSTYDLLLPVNGETHYVHTTLVPQVDAVGKIVQMVGTSHDRTAEFAAAESQVEILNTTNELEDFITMAAHDLRAPMRNVRDLADLLREDFEDRGDGKLELIDMLEDVASKATHLIADVLTHAQAVNAIERTTQFDLAVLCKDIFSVLDPMGKQTLIAQPCLMTTDRTAVQIVLRNLMENAMKHCAQNSVELTVSAKAESDGMIAFQVEDDGSGFPDPTIAFLDSGELRTDSGFGLFGVRRLVHARGGDIVAANLENDAGSLISFSLPGDIENRGQVGINLSAIPKADGKSANHLSG